MTTVLAAGAADHSIVGWVIGYIITGVVVLVVVALVLPILLLAHRIGREAARIDEQLELAVENTAALAGLNTTIEHAAVITAGLKRGRKLLGG
jgi:hydrogenase-4 membrane subunit HyfE